MDALLNVVKQYLGVQKLSPVADLDVLPNLFELSIRNKVLPIVHSVLGQGAYDLPVRLGEAMNVLIEHEKARAREHLAETRRVGALLDSAGISYAVRKGASLLHLYRQPWHRPYEDIDILIAREDAAQLQALLAEDGYLPGAYDRYALKVKPLSRQAQLQYRLSPDHLPHYHKLASDTKLTAYMVDVAFTSGWYKDGLACDTGAELKRAVKRDGIYVLGEEDGFVNLALHLYRESFLPGTVLKSAPSLRSFVDVYLYYKSLDEPARLWMGGRSEACQSVLRVVVELVGAVFGEPLLNEPRCYSDEQLLFSMVRDGRHEYLGLSLVERMQFLSHRQYAAWINALNGAAGAAFAELKNI